jgi:hypothetical protein
VPLCGLILAPTASAASTNFARRGPPVISRSAYCSIRNSISSTAGLLRTAGVHSSDFGNAVVPLPKHERQAACRHEKYCVQFDSGQKQ